MKVLFAAGTQFAFPRLARVVGAIAEARPGWSLVYQAGPEADVAQLTPFAHLRVQSLFNAVEYQRLFEEAELVVTHAGMGNIMACLERGKPFLMMPRLARLAEHRNDHQWDTAEAISRIYGVPFFQDVDPLVDVVLDQDAVPLLPEGLGERIRQERQAFGQGLNVLIKGL